MISAIYIERELRQQSRVKELLLRFPNVPHIECEHYSELFNRNHQNFRLQKKMPALILAKKDNKYVLPTPVGYGVGAQHNYYFSHMLNCMYDCRYCFLQGLYNSANYVLFINYESFEQDMERIVATHQGESVGLFSGYDCDSLALEPVSQFVDYFLGFFAKHPQAILELRTKSTQVRTLLDREPLSNCIVAFSFTAEPISNALEHKVPKVQKRLDALGRVQQAGWPIGLRFDPVIYTDTYQQDFTQLCKQVFAVVDVQKLHSVSLGAFRLPQQFMTKIVNLYPDEKLFAGQFEKQGTMMSYPKDLEQEMIAYCESVLFNYINADQYFYCDPVS
ncbi:Spore photoproduct lyase [hydrothermal vent metagenome]|uniref:Spore photoproduct lyase n=1 Tax=hydrothermal vent metagenome TaxID=652676 RepID=A0A3B0Z280_9ZZZZ